jgi:hypothetical protein
MIAKRVQPIPWTALLVAICFRFAPAPADILILADGKSVEGEVTDRGEAYEVKTRYGVLSIKNRM